MSNKNSPASATTPRLFSSCTAWFADMAFGSPTWPPARISHQAFPLFLLAPDGRESLFVDTWPQTEAPQAIHSFQPGCDKLLHQNYQRQLRQQRENFIPYDGSNLWVEIAE